MRNDEKEQTVGRSALFSGHLGVENVSNGLSLGHDESGGIEGRCDVGQKGWIASQCRQGVLQDNDRVPIQ